MNQKYNATMAEFFLSILCADILIEVLQFGNRRQLTKLAAVGQQFYLLIQAFFHEKPFLRLNLELIPRFFYEMH